MSQAPSTNLKHHHTLLWQKTMFWLHSLLTQSGFHNLNIMTSSPTHQSRIQALDPYGQLNRWEAPEGWWERRFPARPLVKWCNQSIRWIQGWYCHDSMCYVYRLHTTAFLQYWCSDRLGLIRLGSGDESRKESNPMLWYRVTINDGCSTHSMFRNMLNWFNIPWQYILTLSTLYIYLGTRLRNHDYNHFIQYIHTKTFPTTAKLENTNLDK